MRADLRAASLADQLLADASSLIPHLIGRFTNADGFLAQRVDVDTGEISDPVHNLGDLGDYAQYVFHLGQLGDNPAWRDWATRQVVDSAGRIEADSGTRITPFGNGLFRYSNLNGDYIWGVLSHALLSGNAAALALGERYLDEIDRRSTLSEGFIAYGGAILPGGLAVRVPVTNTLIHGQMAEPLLHLYEQSGDQGYLQRAIRYLTPWLPRDAACDRFLRSRLVTDPLVAVLDRARRKPDRPTYKFAKGNAFFIAPLIILDRLSGGAYQAVIERWLVLVDDHVTRGMTSLNNVALNTILEVLLEHFNVYRAGRSRNLIVALIAELDRRIDSTGLLAVKAGSNQHHIDHHVDYAINLIKASELLDDKELLARACEFITTFMAAFRAPYGYYETLDAGAGTRKAAVNSKYLGLILKVAIAMVHRSRPGGVFGTVTSRNLLSDR